MIQTPHPFHSSEYNVSNAAQGLQREIAEEFEMRV